MRKGTRAEKLLKERFQISATVFAETAVWKVPLPLAGSSHEFKYGLALVSDGVCVMRYDNEAGKGDHKHIGETQVSYQFSTLERLQIDFWNDVEFWRQQA